MSDLVKRGTQSHWTGSADERYLRRLLASRSGIDAIYWDDGEAYAQAPEAGISIDFMREPVAAIDAKLRALGVARADALEAQQAEIERLRKDAELLAWVLAHPETAAEELTDAAWGRGGSRENLESRMALLDAAKERD